MINFQCLTQSMADYDRLSADIRRLEQKMQEIRDRVLAEYNSRYGILSSEEDPLWSLSQLIEKKLKSGDGTAEDTEDLKALVALRVKREKLSEFDLSILSGNISSPPLPSLVPRKVRRIVTTLDVRRLIYQYMYRCRRMAHDFGL